MRLSVLGIIALCVLAFSSCRKDGMTDAQLIQAIQNATNKQNINGEELPASSRAVLEQDYSESYIDNGKIAPELGYEVGMRRGEGSCIGELSRVYFNLEGRMLRLEGHRDKYGKDRKECFDFVYPVTMVMPDGSTITGNNREELGLAIKSWYEANPDSEEKPELQYPVEVTFEDGTTAIITNDEDMKRAYKACE